MKFKDQQYSHGDIRWRRIFAIFPRRISRLEGAWFAWVWVKEQFWASGRYRLYGWHEDTNILTYARLDEPRVKYIPFVRPKPPDGPFASR